MSWIRSLSTTPFLVGIALLLNASPAESQNPYTSAADVAEGQRLFELDCAIGHGGDATGGRGSDPMGLSMGPTYTPSWGAGSRRMAGGRSCLRPQEPTRLGL